VADNFLEKKHQSYLLKKQQWEQKKRWDRLKKLCVKKDSNYKEE